MALSEAELHGLVDGQLESDRRADVLRRLAMSPVARALVDSWQEQNELIRTAFGDIEREPLPASLDLAPPRLHCVPAVRPGPLLPVNVDQKSARNRRIAAGLATLVLMTAGLGGSWFLMGSTGKDQAVAGPKVLGTTEATLAERVVTALDLDVRSTPRPARRQGASLVAGNLPTTAIPDLWTAGFSLTSAEADATEPAALVFHYRNGGAEHVVISVARDARDGTAAPPARIGATFSWHHRDTTFAIAGTIAPERLRAIAVALQRDDGDE